MIRTITHNAVVRGLVVVLALTVGLYAPPIAAGTRTADAEISLDDLADRGLAILKSGDPAAADRDLALRRLVHEAFALELIGQFVAGRHWRTMSGDQRADFQELFAEWLLTTYARRLGGHDGQSVEIVDSMELQNKTRDVLVRTRISAADVQLPVTADWRVREFEGELKIIDIVVENVSMALAQRAEIDSAIRRDGVEGLLENLRSRLAVLVADTQ